MSGVSLTVSCAGRRVNVLAWRAVESVWMYAGELYITVAEPLSSSEWVWEETGCRYVSVAGSLDGSSHWQYKCFPYTYWQQCSVFSSPCAGSYTISSLCSLLSLPYASPHAESLLQSFQWVLGGHRCQPLLDKLCLGAACSGGGCSTLHYTLGGELWYADLMALQSQQIPAFSFMGTTSDLRGDVQSEVSAPSNMVFIFDSDEGVGSPVRVAFGDGSTVGGYKTYLSNASLKSYREWTRRNAFGRGTYRSMSTEYKNVHVLSGAVQAGSLCVYADGSSDGRRGLCLGYRSEFSSQGNVLSLDIVLL